MFLYVCKQTLHISKVRISQRVKGVIMRNLCDTLFIWSVPSKANSQDWDKNCTKNEEMLNEKLHFLSSEFSAIQSPLKLFWFSRYFLNWLFGQVEKWLYQKDKVNFKIFCLSFEEKYFPCYILLTDQIPLSGCLYFVRYWEISVF